MKKDIKKNDLLNALRVKKQLPLAMTKEDQAKASVLLTKHPSISEVFDIVDLLVTPHQQELGLLSKRLSLTSMVLDKVAKYKKVPKKELDTMWKDAEAELKEANKKQIAKMRKEFNDMVKQNTPKKDEKKEDK